MFWFFFFPRAHERSIWLLMVLTFINILGHTQPLLCSQWLQFLFEGQRSKKPWQQNSVGSLQPTPPPSVHLGSGAVGSTQPQLWVVMGWHTAGPTTHLHPVGSAPACKWGHQVGGMLHHDQRRSRKCQKIHLWASSFFLWDTNRAPRNPPSWTAVFPAEIMKCVQTTQALYQISGSALRPTASVAASLKAWRHFLDRQKMKPGDRFCWLTTLGGGETLFAIPTLTSPLYSIQDGWFWMEEPYWWAEGQISLYPSKCLKRDVIIFCFRTGKHRMICGFWMCSLLVHNIFKGCSYTVNVGRSITTEILPKISASSAPTHNQ